MQNFHIYLTFSLFSFISSVFQHFTLSLLLGHSERPKNKVIFAYLNICLPFLPLGNQNDACLNQN